MTSILHTIVDHVVLLSMEKEKIRHMNEQFSHLGISAKLFVGIAGKDVQHLYPSAAAIEHGVNALGNLESFKTIMKQYQDSKAIALFEDETILVHDFNEHLKTFMQEVPKTWDMIYFSANHIYKPERITENVYRIMGSWGIHGVILNKKVYDKVIKMANKVAAPFDVVLHDLQYETEAYCINPHISYPYPSYSSVQQSFSFYNFPSPNMI